MIFDIGGLHESWFAVGEENRWIKAYYWFVRRLEPLVAR